MSEESSRQEHPEADLLAGFAENSLAPYERESILSHLAICTRCRQAVFLAHQVAPPVETDTRTTNLDVRSFWRRNWFPVVASASAVVALAAITFSWYGQSRRSTVPPGYEVAQQRPAPVPPSNAIASKTGNAVPPSAPAALQGGSSTAQRVTARKEAKKEIASPSPLLESHPAETAGAESPRRDHDIVAAKAATEHREMKAWLGSTAQKGRAESAMKSASRLNEGVQGGADFSPRTMQSANRPSSDGWNQPSSGAGGADQVYRQRQSADAAEPNQMQESNQVHAEGCVQQGVEAGCLMVKDRQSGKLYHILIKGSRPQPGDGIEFTGVQHDGPTYCMQGVPVDVITWVNKGSLHCAQGEAPQK